MNTRERLEMVLIEVAEREAKKKDATPEELKALAEIASVLKNLILLQ